MAGRLDGVRVVVGVGGGIAAYKAVELVRALQTEGAAVRVAMTPAAQKFVGPLTFEALTRHNVMTDVMALAADKSIEHVEWGHWAQVLVVAPATADVLARMAAGLAHDPVGCLFVCTAARTVVAPAMEPLMWQHPITQKNLATLVATQRVTVVPPEDGPLASGRSGVGRLAAPQAIVDAVAQGTRPRDLGGVEVLVTAGPTQEPLDPVRFISNRSSGKMGVALAQAALSRGANVTLVYGPLQVDIPAGVQPVPVTTALDMMAALQTHLPRAQLLLMAAAVSDFRPQKVASQKIKKGLDKESLALVANPDLLQTTRDLNPSCVRVGFAAETQHVERNAAEKLKRKGLRLIVANDVSQNDAGFQVDTNRITLLDGKTVERLPLQSKLDAAHAVLDRVLPWVRFRR